MKEKEEEEERGVVREGRWRSADRERGRKRRRVREERGERRRRWCVDRMVRRRVGMGRERKRRRKRLRWRCQRKRKMSTMTSCVVRSSIYILSGSGMTGIFVSSRYLPTGPSTGAAVGLSETPAAVSQ